MPRGHAAMRAVKAEGGWGVVCTEEVEIHHSTDLSPFIEGRLWDEADIPAYALIADSIHKHGSLAGIELTYNSHGASNLYSRCCGDSQHARERLVFEGVEQYGLLVHQQDRPDPGSPALPER